MNTARSFDLSHVAVSPAEVSASMATESAKGSPGLEDHDSPWPGALNVLYVTYNSSEWIGRSIVALERAAAEAQVRLKIVVSDNASADDTLAVAQRAEPSAVLCANEANLGYAGGVNRALLHADRRYPTLILNPDVLLYRRSLAELFAMAIPARVGIVGCRLMMPDGSDDLAAKRNLPTPLTSVVGMARNVAPRQLARFDHYRAVDLAPDQDGEVEAVCGAFMLVLPELLETIGGYDERFFMYGEDLDFCRRAIDAGYTILYRGSVAVFHAKRASIGYRNNARSWRWHRDSMLLYYDKHFARLYPNVVNGCVRAAVRSQYSSRLLRDALQNAVSIP
jgi:GT2 family glycosyltransferase